MKKICSKNNINYRNIFDTKFQFLLLFVIIALFIIIVLFYNTIYIRYSIIIISLIIIYVKKEYIIKLLRGFKDE